MLDSVCEPKVLKPYEKDMHFKKHNHADHTPVVAKHTYILYSHPGRSEQNAEINIQSPELGQAKQPETRPNEGTFPCATC